MFVTITPCSVAAFRSMASKPTPHREITFNCFASSEPSNSGVYGSTPASTASIPGSLPRRSFRSAMPASSASVSTHPASSKIFFAASSTAAFRNEPAVSNTFHDMAGVYDAEDLRQARLERIFRCAP